MNAPDQNHKSEPETTLLHLGKVVAASVPSDETAGEGVTAYVTRAAAEAMQESSKPVVVPKSAGPLPPKSMLGAVSYCYAKGVYGSEDIERKMQQDTEFRASCGQKVPRPEDIRRFRRLNREAIQATLEKTFRFARKKVVEALKPSNPFRSASGEAVSATPVSGKPEETQAIVRREAAERLDKASFIDGMSM